MSLRTKLPVIALATLIALGAVVVTIFGGSETARTPAQLSPLEEPMEAMLARQLSGDPDVDLGKAYQRAVAQSKAIASQTAQKAPGVAAAKWDLVGPTSIGGRLLEVVVDPERADTVYVAAASGGVWTSTDAGKTLKSIWPDDLPQPIGGLAMTPSGILYAGTGETGPGGGSITYGGTGMYMSKDRGQTWENIGLKGTSRISEVVVDPADEKKIWVAASGNLFKPGGERGIYRSDDGGKTWNLKLEGDNPTTGGSDIAINPKDPKIVYAVMWDHQRTPDQRRYNGLGSGLFKSTDGGETWARIGTPFFGPNPELGRLGLGLAPSEPDTLYVQSSGTSGAWTGFYKSTNGGTTWTPMADTDQVGLGGASVYGWWFGRVWVDPSDANHVFIAGVNLLESNDGGQTISVGGAGVHADQHGMAWDGKVKDRVYLANDGGLYRSDDNGKEWAFAEYQPYSQLYSGDVSEQDPSRQVAGLQDNGVNRSYPENWNSYVGGDGEAARINPKNQDIVYGCYQYGECAVSHNGGDTVEFFTNEVVGTRKGWFTPIEFDPANPSIVYTGSEMVSRSMDDGGSWQPISPDLSNGPGKETNPLFRNYGTITTISAATLETGKIYVGTDDGNLWYTDTGNAPASTWTKVADSDVPKAWVTRVQVDPNNKDIAYATFSGFRQGEDAAYILRTADGGKTWDNISGDLPKAPLNDVNVVGQDVVVASDVGVFVTRDLGKSWLKIGRNLPLAPVHELRYHQPTNHLYAATFGRSMFKVDYSALDKIPSVVGPPKRGKVRLLPTGCARNGKLTLRLKTPKGQKLRKVTLRIGKKKLTLTGKRIRRKFTVRVKRSVKIRVSAVAKSGKKYSDSRTYKTCKKKKRRR